MTNLLIPAVLGLLLASCAAHAPARATNLIEEQSCPPRSKVENSWQVVVDDTGEYDLRLPPSATRSEPGKYAFVHGGQAWESEDLDASISFGHWAEYSFQQARGTRCYVTLDGITVLLIVSPTEVHAWYAMNPGSHEPVLVVSSKTLGQERLVGIALSLRRHAV